MRRLNRLLRYVRPYWFYLLASVISMALVGLFDAFRLLLIGPIFDRVLNPAAQGSNLPLIRVPLSHRTIELGWFVPEHFHNVWTIVAFALVASTVLKGIFDYVGTYLVNYAGFGMITDLRNELYTATLRRSVAFFQKHSTGTLLSAIVNDIERVQFAMSSVLAEFLQQFFTFIFTGVVVIGLGGRLTWVLMIFVPFVVTAARRVGTAGAQHHPQGAGQAGRDPEHPARNHHRNAHRQSLLHGSLGDAAASARRRGVCSAPTCARRRPSPSARR